ncbi:MAG: electron transfer flavoprotein subunit alpha/FixB family protein [Hyperthermus sp.]|nr:MAG: electron transfer flavoprotein subunit alpha/FixB family protein [Hyperthermus sp.]
MRMLGFTYNEEGLGELAGLAAALGLEAYALAVGSRDSVADYSYSVFKRIYYAPRMSTDQAFAVISDLYDKIKPDMIVAPSLKDNTTVLAMLASNKKLAMFTEAFGIVLMEGKIRAKRRVMGGRAEAYYEASTPIALTIARGYYAPPASSEKGAGLEEVKPPASKLTILSVEVKEKGSVDLESASIVVGVGRGFRRKEDLRLAEQLASLLNGVVGASRPIVADYGWLSEDRWIGISGKKIKPKIYIAIGISGAPQHMAAVMDAETIVAINKDKNAPVFQYADYGVVADLYKFVPKLIEKLREKLGGR